MGKTSNSKSTHSFVSLLNAYSRDTSTQKKSSFVPVSKKQKNEKYISDPLSRLNQISLSNPQPVVLPSMPSKKRSHSTSPSIPKLVESSPTSQHRSSGRNLCPNIHQQLCLHSYNHQRWPLHPSNHQQIYLQISLYQNLLRCSLRKTSNCELIQ